LGGIFLLVSNKIYLEMNPLGVFMSYYMILTERSHVLLLWLPGRSHVLLLWLPGHKGIEGNNISEKLAKTGSLPHL
jgi:hypothetical protein